MMKKLFVLFTLSLVIEIYPQFIPESFSLSGEKKHLNKLFDSNPVSNTITDIVTIGDTVWIGTSRGVSVSYDRGENWTNFYNTEVFGDLGVSAVAYNKYDGSVWIATAQDVEIPGGETLPEGRGYKYSTDGGLNWSSVPQPIDDPGDSLIAYGINDGINLPFVRALPITTGINNVTYDIAFTDGVIWIASYASGLRKSTDRGQTWQRVVLPSDSLDEVTPYDTIKYALQPVAGDFGPDQNLNHEMFSVISINDSTIYAGSAGGIDKSTDGGISWRKFNHTNQKKPISGNWVVALKYNQSEQKLWAGTRRADDPMEFFGVSSTSDGGENWETFLDDEYVWNLGLKENDIFVATNNGIFRSSDEGATWILPNNIIDRNSGVILTTKEFYSVSAVEENGGVWDIWLGSGDGLAKLRETSFWQGEWRIYLASQSLVSEKETYCYPNPYSPKLDQLKIKYSTGGKDAPVTIRIFDFGMNYVRTILQNAMRNKTIASPPDFWDGKNDAGNIVPNGVYIYRVDVGSDKPLFGKIIVMQ